VCVAVLVLLAFGRDVVDGVEGPRGFLLPKTLKYEDITLFRNVGNTHTVTEAYKPEHKFCM
jgi:hypothetical protein